jgi:hypothetical protein
MNSLKYFYIKKFGKDRGEHLFTKKFMNSVKKFKTHHVLLKESRSKIQVISSKHE